MEWIIHAGKIILRVQCPPGKGHLNRLLCLQEAKATPMVGGHVQNKVLGAAGSRSRSPGSRIGRGFAHLLVVVVVGQGGPGAVAVAHQDRRVSGRRGAVAAPVPTGFGRRQLG